MSMQDPISDMLTRIRNAQSVGKQTVDMPSAKQKLAILKVMQDEGYIASFSVNKDQVVPAITVTLKYHEGSPVMTALKRVSRPGLRIYKSCSELPKVVGGLGIAIVSTSKGVMSDRKARLANAGGEVLCLIW